MRGNSTDSSSAEGTPRHDSCTTWAGSIAAGGIELPDEDPQAVLAALGPLATLLLWLGPVNVIRREDVLRWLSLHGDFETGRSSTMQPG